VTQQLRRFSSRQAELRLEKDLELLDRLDQGVRSGLSLRTLPRLLEQALQYLHTRQSETVPATAAPTSSPAEIETPLETARRRYRTAKSVHTNLDTHLPWTGKSCRISRDWLISWAGHWSAASSWQLISTGWGG